MRSNKHEKNRNTRRPPFDPFEPLHQQAWRALSDGAQVLYLGLSGLRSRFKLTLHNNGTIILSQRMAAKELNSHHNQLDRWVRELQHYGFIVLSHLGDEEDQCDGKQAEIYFAMPIAPQTAAPMKQASNRVRLQPRSRVHLEPTERLGMDRRSDADASLAGGAASMPAEPPGVVEARPTTRSQMHPQVRPVASVQKEAAVPKRWAGRGKGRQTEAETVSLARWQFNAIRAGFKAGIKPSLIARQFGLSQSDVSKVLRAIPRPESR
jgi:hypothetical protein